MRAGRRSPRGKSLLHLIERRWLCVMAFLWVRGALTLAAAAKLGRTKGDTLEVALARAFGKLHLALHNLKACDPVGDIADSAGTGIREGHLRHRSKEVKKDKKSKTCSLGKCVPAVAWTTVFEPAATTMSNSDLAGILRGPGQGQLVPIVGMAPAEVSPRVLLNGGFDDIFRLPSCPPWLASVHLAQMGASSLSFSIFRACVALFRGRH